VPINPSLPSPAPEILDYLARRPDSQDTIDGILHWWVLDAHIRNWAPKIAKTVAQLVEQGFLDSVKARTLTSILFLSGRGGRASAR